MTTTVITVGADGPYHVAGDVRIVSEGGKEFAVEDGQAWLCRCGHSANKPFCDGSHAAAEFRSDPDQD